MWFNKKTLSFTDIDNVNEFTLNLVCVNVNTRKLPTNIADCGEANVSDAASFHSLD